MSPYYQVTSYIAQDTVLINLKHSLPTVLSGQLPDEERLYLSPSDKGSGSSLRIVGEMCVSPRLGGMLSFLRCVLYKDRNIDMWQDAAGRRESQGDI